MTDPQPDFSEEFVNAFVDNQLGPDDTARACALLGESEIFNRQVCEARKLRDLLCLAYPVTEQHAPRALLGHARWARHVAAVVLLGVGILIGWTVRNGGTGSVTPPPLNAATTALESPSAGRVTKVLFHLNSGSPRRMREVLDEAQNLLDLYRTQGQPAEIEIIANGQGINLLRQRHSPFAARIKAMHEQYANLTFAACQNTIDRIVRQEGVHPRLLPEARVVDSAVAQIIRLQQRGWAYIRV